MWLGGGNTFWRLLSQRVCAGVVLVAYLLAVIGFSVPASAGKGGIPFPCQDHPCGCQSAEQCWRSCCCFSVEERWAWAAAHHVEPPAYAVRPSHADTGPVEEHAVAARATSCCEKERPAADHTGNPPSHSGPSLLWVGGPAGLGCRGVSTLWIASGAVTLPPAPLTCEPYAAPVGCLSLLPESPLGLRLAPPDPPPRSAHC